jgi:hypothetical protein
LNGKRYGPSPHAMNLYFDRSTIDLWSGQGSALTGAQCEAAMEVRFSSQEGLAEEGADWILITATDGGGVTRFGRAARSNCGGGINSSAKCYGR